MDKTARILFICLSVALAAGVGYFWKTRNAEPESHLVILHTNDTHSHFEPVRDDEYPGMGGIIERAAYLDSVRVAEGPENVLLLHAGDFSQGTTYFSELGGNLEVQALNAMKYDVVTLGNHEFDNGLEDLGRRLSSLEMPVVVCNYDFSPFEAGKYIKPYVIVDLLKVDEGCDLVIALTHIGYTEHTPGDITDPILCSKTRNLDLIVGGHSHTFLEEMVYLPNVDGVPTPVVQDGCYGIFWGRVDYSF